MSAARSEVRVLWLTKGLGRGGAETLLVEAARCLQDANLQLEVAYVLKEKEALVAALEEAGVRTRCLAGRRAGGWVIPLARLLRSEQHDVVHTHAPVVAAAARLLAPRGLPLVHTEHNTWDRYRMATRWANAVTLRRCTIVWPVSHGVADSITLWRRSSRPRVEVMLHGIAPGRIHHGTAARSAARQRLGLSPEQVAIVCVGNLTQKKDHDTLLGAVEQLRRRDHHVALHVVGAGPRRQHLAALVEKLGIASQVSFLGSRDDVAEILPAYDVFALSSRHEGLPIACLEAMAAGVPIVATRVGGVPELITDGVHGLLVSSADAGGLSIGLERVLGDPVLAGRLRTNGLLRAEEFGIASAATRLANAYGELSRHRREKAAA